MGKRKQKTSAEPNNKKAAKLNTEDEKKNASIEVEEEATQNIADEVLPKKNEKQEVTKGDEDTEEPKKAEGNGNQNSGKKKKKKNKASNEANQNEASHQLNDDYVFTKEDAEKLLETFSKEELADVLKSALQKHEDIVSEIEGLACKDPSKRKLFVRGLDFDTKAETLKSVFSAYGSLEKADVVMHKNSDKNKGFGFVTFKSIAGVMAALKEPTKKIDGRTTICNLSNVSPAAAEPQQGFARKIYVGGLPNDVDSDKLVKFFSQYGEIQQGPLGFDRNTGKCKGFAFFIYTSEKSAKSALQEPTKDFDGVTLICKAAPHKDKDKDKDKNGSPANLGQANMWAYGSPLTGFVPVGNFRSPLLQQPFLTRR